MKFQSTIGCLLLVFAGCSANESVMTPDDTKQATAKNGAPVDVAVQRINDNTAQLRITFREPSKGVTIKTYGVDGLRVLGNENSITGKNIAAGSFEDIDVRYQPGTGKGYIGVHVTGEFSGITRARVTSVEIVDPNVVQPAKTDASIEVDSNGQRVHVTPANKR